MDVQHGILTYHEILNTLEQIQNGRFDLYLDNGVGLASLICVKKQTLNH